MNASKENAKKAQSDLWQAAEMMDKVLTKEQRDPIKRTLTRVLAFLESAERKLPTEAAYKRDKDRRAEKAKA
jgi:hypothetical protein